MKVENHAITHIGRRVANEDSFAVAPHLGVFVVADGMGGYEGGEVASKLAVDTITEFFSANQQDGQLTWPFGVDAQRSLSENMVDVSIRLANRAICERRTGRLAAMGTTIVLLYLVKNKAIIGHIGDSRLYRLRGGVLQQLTVDHSLYEQLKAEGQLHLPDRSEFPWDNIITRALGMDNVARPDLCTVEIEDGDTYLLCTDGLTGPLDDERIERTLRRAALEEAGSMLIQEALDRGGKDNITAVLLRTQNRADSPTPCTV